ncbi:hypothetical protein [Sorangium sp. So ce388]|uniref:hypothetical protein n=1 Tax=Sorangium sp. So ce388 TaxID=3133309 RepID=UPI003F5BE513
MPKTGHKAPLAPVISDLKVFYCARHMISDLQGRMERVRVAPVAELRAYELKAFWAAAAQTEKKLSSFTAPGLRGRVAGLQQQFDAVYLSASMAALAMSQERGCNVVSLAEARAQRVAAAR